MANYIYVIAVIMTVLYPVCSVDDVARLTSLEAEQRTLQTHNHALETEIKEQEEKNKELEEKMETLNQTQKNSLKALDVKLQADVFNLTAIVKALPASPDLDLDLAAPLDGCLPGNHKVLENYWRLVNNRGGFRCDMHLKVGWYRFKSGYATNAILPTTCPPGYRCGTEGTTWIDLYTGLFVVYPPKPGEQAFGRACTRVGDDCCYPDFEIPDITIRNCGGEFFIYHLKPAKYCAVAYCIEKQRDLLG